MKLFIELIIFIAAILCQIECANILGILPTHGVSHHRAGATLLKILAEHGHNITVVGLFKEKNPPKNYKEIVLDGLFQENVSILPTHGVSHHRAGVVLLKILAEHGHNVTVVGLFSENNLSKNYREIVLDGLFNESVSEEFFKFCIKPITFWEKWTLPFITQQIMDDETVNVLNHKKFQNLLRSNETFDVVLMEDFGATALKYAAYHFKTPLIVYSPLNLNQAILAFQGSPDNPAYIPYNFDEELTSYMDFWERLQSTFHYVIRRLVFGFVLIPSQNEILHRYYPDAPHINEFIYNVSLALVNADPSVNDPLPRVPSIKNIGGFHIAQPKALPQDMRKLLDEAENGVILFSLGTNFKSKFIPEEIKQLILRVFSKLNETVLWKFEEDLPGKPDNVYIQKWLPQNDILAHKNLKLLICHGGIFGIMEAVYNGIPMFIIPLFGDQKTNAKQAEAAGYAKWKELYNLEENDMGATIKELLTNSKYSEAAKRRSSIFKDKPMSPKDSITYWVDYVIRHKGADHLRVASLNLSWYQNMLLDVIGLILGCIVLFIVIVKVLICKIVNIMRRKKNRVRLTEFQ